MVNYNIKEKVISFREGGNIKCTYNEILVGFIDYYNCK